MRKTKKDKYIKTFNPDVTLLDSDSYQDFFPYLTKFNAGEDYYNFNEFIVKDALEYSNKGEGVTYVVWNQFFDEDGRQSGKDVVAYYTLSTTAIPFEDRIRNDEEEYKKTGDVYNSEICGISAIEIKMFAVSVKYQDTFFEYQEEILPISAWIMRNIVNSLNEMINNVVGFKAVLLHSVPEAEKFYIANGFNRVEKNMQPLHCIDSEYQAMYLTLREVCMNYDE